MASEWACLLFVAVRRLPGDAASKLISRLSAIAAVTPDEGSNWLAAEDLEPL